MCVCMCVHVCLCVCVCVCAHLFVFLFLCLDLCHCLRVCVCVFIKHTHTQTHTHNSLSLSLSHTYTNTQANLISAKSNSIATESENSCILISPRHIWGKCVKKEKRFVPTIKLCYWSQPNQSHFNWILSHLDLTTSYCHYRIPLPPHVDPIPRLSPI